MIKRELTNLEERLYDFLDYADGVLEYDVSQKSLERLREAMKKCKEDCKVKYGVISTTGTHCMSNCPSTWTSTWIERKDGKAFYRI